MDRQQAQDVIQSALEAGRNDGMEAGIEGQSLGFTRFSNERITQNLSGAKDVLTVRACFGRREGTARTTDLTRDSVRAAVRAAEDLARHAGENLEFCPPVGPMPVPEVGGFHEKTQAFGPFDRAKKVRGLLEACARAGHSCAGLIGNGTLTRAAGTSAGQFAFQRKSTARMHCTVITEDSSGWKRASAENVDDIDADAVFEAALRKAEASRRPVEIEPGRYTVVLEPPAVGEMLAFWFWFYTAKLAHEGRSFMSGKVGQRVADERVTIASVPGHPAVPGFGFLPDGQACRRIAWIDKGRAANLVTDRYWAAKLGVEATGWLPNAVMDGTDASADELLAGVDRGILVSRFWYVRTVDEMTLLVTGMTRDGTFLIENGRATKGIKNMRWNDSVPRVLDSIAALGRPERTGEYVEALVPTLVVRDFHFTSKTLF
jgi:predicted Zn-dependent protease